MSVVASNGNGRLDAHEGNGRVVSGKRIAANRKNAKKSTGPRTAAGKARSSRNAFKHGLCSTIAVGPGECDAAFGRLNCEVYEELDPATLMQRMLADQIALVYWKMRRFPHVERNLLDPDRTCPKDNALDEKRLEELKEVPPACDLIADAMLEGPSNAFCLFARYERGYQNTLMRLIRQFYWLKKHHPVVEPTRQEIIDEQLWLQEKGRRADALREGRAPRPDPMEAWEIAAEREAEEMEEEQRRWDEEEAREAAARSAGATPVSDAAAAAADDPDHARDTRATGEAGAGEAGAGEARAARETGDPRLPERPEGEAEAEFAHLRGDCLTHDETNPTPVQAGTPAAPCEQHESARERGVDG